MVCHVASSKSNKNSLECAGGKNPRKKCPVAPRLCLSNNCHGLNSLATSSGHKTISAMSSAVTRLRHAGSGGHEKSALTIRRMVLARRAVCSSSVNLVRHCGMFCEVCVLVQRCDHRVGNLCARQIKNNSPMTQAHDARKIFQCKIDLAQAAN